MCRDYVIERYRAPDGRVPFADWLSAMKHRAPEVVYRVLTRINRAQKGNFGDYKYVREGVWEIRLDVGPGFRLYFAFEQKRVVLLLIAGDKSSQKTDIHKAISYWKDHQNQGTFSE